MCVATLLVLVLIPRHATRADAQLLPDASAPPIALAAAALVLGVAVGFAVTFGIELHRPRVADAAEAVRVTGVPTLASITPHGLEPLLARRAADRDLSPLINPASDAYRRVFVQVSDPLGANPLGFPLVAVTGDEAAIVATVATNIAVAAINDSRTALLIDADPDAGLVAGIAGVPRQPGVSDVLAGRLDWAAVTRSAGAGRGRTIDVIPAGHRDPRLSSGAGPVTAAPIEEIGRAELRAELLRLGRRYELIVVASPAGAPHVDTGSILPVSDAIVCARVAFTTLTRLAASVAVLQDSGLRVRGVVLWDADTPPRASD